MTFMVTSEGPGALSPRARSANGLLSRRRPGRRRFLDDLTPLVEAKVGVLLRLDQDDLDGDEHPVDGAIADDRVHEALDLFHEGRILGLLTEDARGEGLERAEADVGVLERLVPRRRRTGLVWQGLLELLKAEGGCPERRDGLPLGLLVRRLLDLQLHDVRVALDASLLENRALHTDLVDALLQKGATFEGLGFAQASKQISGCVRHDLVPFRPKGVLFCR